MRRQQICVAMLVVVGVTSSTLYAGTEGSVAQQPNPDRPKSADSEAAVAGPNASPITSPEQQALQTPVPQEEGINEQTIARALTPDDTGGDVTRGFVLSNKPPGAVRSSHKVAALDLVIFASNSSTLTPAAQATLDTVARALRSEQLAAYRFLIEGHADSRGSPEANLRLSQERAAAVVEYLITKGGISSERLSQIGKGSYEPLDPRYPAAPGNRRVTIATVKE